MMPFGNMPLQIVQRHPRPPAGDAAWIGNPHGDTAVAGGRPEIAVFSARRICPRPTSDLGFRWRVDRRHLRRQTRCWPGVPGAGSSKDAPDHVWHAVRPEVTSSRKATRSSPSVSAESTEHLVGWDALRNTLGELRACHGEFESFFSDVFDELGSLSGRLGQRGNQWQIENQRTEQQFQQRADQIEEQRRALAECLKKFQETHDHHGRTSAESGARVLQVLEEAKRQQEEMSHAQNQVNSQVVRLAAIAAELAEARNQTTPAAAVAVADGAQLNQMLEESRRQRAEMKAAQEAAEAQAEKLAALVGELAEARSEATAATPVADGAQLNQMLEESRQQRAEMKAAQEAATQIQAERLAGLTAELCTVRNEMALVREEIGRHESIQRSEADETARQHAEELAGNEFQEQLRQLERQQGMLEQEKQLLESELESVRNRAVEMANTLAEQKREAAQQQNQWADEIKRMRRLLEDVSHRLADAVPAATGSAAASAAPPPTAAAASAASAPYAATAANKAAPSGEDPVLESVLAQFEMLQRDLARRRADGVAHVPGT